MIDTSKEKAKGEILINYIKSTDSSKWNTFDAANELGLDHQVVVGEAKSLEIAEVITLTMKESFRLKVTKDGNDTLTYGSPENVLYNYLKEKGQVTKKDLSKDLKPEVVNRGFSKAMKDKAINYDKATDLITLKDGFDITQDKLRTQLQHILAESQKGELDQNNAIVKELKKEKLITTDIEKYFEFSKGPNFEIGLVTFEPFLTMNHLITRKWKDAHFKKYNLDSFGKVVKNGSLHPLLRVRTQFREILLELGFQEMPTNNFVESSFWNFDSLFQPQQHPARDAHDTFFLKHPKYSKVKEIYPEYFEKVKHVHENGGFGSIGWQYKWSEEEASKNILRTHTTAVSSRMLYKLAQDYQKDGKFTPKKYFSIDRVFRNESLDSTHLAEFHQIEGLVADYDLGLGHLIGTIEDFFRRFGINKLKYKPAFNPYTEPSLEIFAYHEGLKRWVEIGNSGIFRPEMVLPMGLPSNVSVIAWGLSLERPTMIHYGLRNIKELFGHEVNVKDTKNASIYYINSIQD